MTTDGVMEPGERAGMADAAGQPHGLTAQSRPTTTTVPVIPLWERTREGVRR
ncbi:hypothetical protein [Streptomyces sp. NPDC057623]|uniref:hypothetical protein n=1 Tax=Streptomyces sp. NPDC057623 TaxID=3346187 RepID=UPI00369517D2